MNDKRVNWIRVDLGYIKGGDWYLHISVATFRAVLVESRKEIRKQKCKWEITQ